MLNNEDILELQQIYFEETGERISTDEAWEMANRLFRLFDVLTRPIEDSSSTPSSNSV